MRRVVVRRPGGFEALRLEAVPTPEPAPGEVRLRVAAAGVNFADVAVRLGLYASAREYVGWPITPGFDVAGTIEALGEGVRDLAPGTAVLGVTRFGGYASHVCVPREQVFPVPRGMSLVEAGAFPTVTLTAWYALRRMLLPRAGMRVLLHSAAGGVGGAFCQLARLAGLEVVGVVGAPHKVAEAKRLGAAHVIDASREDLWRVAERLAPGGFDAILDANGPATLRRSYRHLAPEGRLVVYGFATMLPRGRGARSWSRLLLGRLRLARFDPLDMTTRNRSVMAFNLSFLFDRRDLLAQAMAELLGHVEAGRLAAPTIRTFPLEQAGEAHRALAGGATVGKLVLTVE